MENVLFVDDDANLLAGMRRTFRKTYNVECAESALEALGKLDSGKRYSVIVSDMRMPKMDGVEFLSKVTTKCPDSMRIMLTGNSDQQTAIDAVNSGHIFSFLTKPCGNEELTNCIESAMEQYRLKSLEKDLLEKTLAGSVKVLVDIMHYTNPLAFGRACAIRELAVSIAKDLGARNVWEIRIATMLSTIGWLSVPDYIIDKVNRRATLDSEEMDLVQRQTEVAYDLLKSVPRLEQVANIIRYQGKNYDGTGFPEGEPGSGEEIPLGSRILKLLNAVTPLNNPERPRYTDMERISLDGSVFDPAVVLVAKQILAEGDQDEKEYEVIHTSIPVGQFLAGDILEQDLVGTDGKLLLSAGSQISEFHIAKLRQNQKFRKITDMIEICRILG